MPVIINDEQLDYQDVLLSPKSTTLNSRKEVNLTVACALPDQRFMAGIPILNANMSTVGNFAVAKAMLDDGMFATLHKHYTYEEILDFILSLPRNQVYRLFVSIGIRDESMTLEKFKNLDIALVLKGYPVPNICIDVPNAYINNAIKLVTEASESYKNRCLIMAGNVCTGCGTIQLCRAGANIIKVGVGPGLGCRTRFVTGVGRPQLSAVLECVEAARHFNASICADGGIRYPGDAAKAFAAGANFVMLGGYYAGTDEADGEFLADPKTGEKVKVFYGMASQIANFKYYGGMADYKTSEGALLYVKYSGTVHQRNLEICGGLRSCCTYCDCKKLYDLPDKAVFYKVRRQHTIIEGDK